MICFTEALSAAPSIQVNFIYFIKILFYKMFPPKFNYFFAYFWNAAWMRARVSLQLLQKCVAKAMGWPSDHIQFSAVSDLQSKSRLLIFQNNISEGTKFLQNTKSWGKVQNSYLSLDWAFSQNLKIWYFYICDTIRETIRKVEKCDFENTRSKVIWSKNINFRFSMEIWRERCQRHFDENPGLIRWFYV